MASIARTSEEHEGRSTSAVNLESSGSRDVGVSLVPVYEARKNPSSSVDNSTISVAP
jgi:hypothetical protein